MPPNKRQQKYMADKKVIGNDWVGTWLEMQPENDVITHDKPPLLSRRKLNSSCSRDLSPFSLARRQYQGVPPHNIEYQESKSKGKVSEKRWRVEEGNDVVDDSAFAQSRDRHDDKCLATRDRCSQSGNAIRLLYCPSSDSLGGPDMTVASHGGLLSSSAKHKKQAPKAQLSDVEEPEQQGFRPRGSTMAHNFEASHAKPMKSGLVHNENVSTGPKSIDKVIAKRERTGTPPKAEGKKGRSTSSGYFAFRDLALGSVRSSRLFEE